MDAPADLSLGLDYVCSRCGLFPLTNSFEQTTWPNAETENVTKFVINETKRSGDLVRCV